MIAESSTPAFASAQVAAVTAELLREKVEARHAKAGRFSSIDLFSGAGGLSIGLERAGFHACLAIDVDEDSCRTYASVQPATQLLDKPIQDVRFSAFDGVDLLAGGPPCQPFSSGGKRLAADDPLDMIPEFIRAVREAGPRAFIMENVIGLFRQTHRDYLLEAVRKLEDLGYQVTQGMLNAAQYGVPQKRRRGFLVGLKGTRFRFPEPTHGPGTSQPFVPSGRCLSPDRIIGEPNPSKVVYAKKPDLRPSPYDGHIYNGGGRPIDLEAPCHTILASAGGNKTHFIDTLGEVPKYHAHLVRGGKPRCGVLPGGRRLTVEESALIQTFPPGMAFAGSRSSQYTQVGNALPPLLAEVLGDVLREALS